MFRKVIIVMGLMSLSILSGCAGSSAGKLDEVHSSIAKRYDDVTHVKAAELVENLQKQAVIFDTRERHEYDVSHIAGAVHIDPEISGDEFLENYAHLIHDKNVVFYCSVGERSSRVARRVNKAAIDSGLEIQTYNLEQGIFGWHNAARDLVRGQETTELLHPYNDSWGKFIERQDKVSYGSK